ncbi:D-alanine--D-alanine ligase [Gammaproteobacteria bacterium]|nr:D-alanine--D-alanine ligase [Gammaproteobacteria bacterium]
MNRDYGKILVLMGGWSNEREISLISGESVFNSLITSGLDVIKLDLNKDNISKVKELNPDRIFIVLHGKGGEDGEIQLHLENLGIPYTGSGSESSKVCMNKRTTKKILLENNIQTPSYIKISKSTNIEDIENSFQYPFVIKPASEGSSIGVYVVEDRVSCKEAINENVKISNDVIVEEYIRGKEYTVGIVDNNALPVIKLIPPGKFYDFEAKYNSKETKYICPSGLDQNTEEEIKKLSLNCFSLLNCRGWGRVDLIIDEKNKPWVIELNTVPGMTEHSLVPMAANYRNINFDELVLKILDTTFK